jgi:hypothetical protein
MNYGKINVLAALLTFTAATKTMITTANLNSDNNYKTPTTSISATITSSTKKLHLNAV